MSENHTHIENIEDELKQKKIQIKSLLTITQAINDNVSAEGLYDMYRSFLSWEMEIEKMALFVIDDEKWSCATSIAYDPNDVDNIIASLKPFKRQYRLEENTIPELQDFGIVIPVYHKQNAIAYALIGGINSEEDIYNRTQFITTITNMIAVAIENKKLFRKQMQQQQYEKELELANSVQQMLIPQRLPDEEKIAVSQIYMPHSDVGGDYLDVVRFNEHRFALCIGDISGKGVAAAILMANFQAKIQSFIRQHRDLKKFIVELNESVYNITKSDKFITFFVAVVDTQEKTINYINCGHYPPVAYVDGHTKLLEKGTTFLGAFNELPPIEDGWIEYNEEAFLLLFTDGLAELKDGEGLYFDNNHIDAFVKQYNTFNPVEFNNLLLKRIDSFKGEQSYSDDIAILTCKLN